MGTRINVLLDHQMADYQDQAAVLERLVATEADALAVADYWLRVDPDSPRWPGVREWTADPKLSRPLKYVNYSGPGALYLSLTSVAAMITTGGRWRGFLSIDPLRRVHLTAFRSIGRALGATSLVFFADNDHVCDLHWDGRTQDEGMAVLQRMWGPPQPSVESIDPAIVKATDHGVPTVWYVETLTGSGNATVSRPLAW